MKGLISLLMQSFKEFSADNGTLLAASVSYNLLLSIFPLLLAAVYIAGSVAVSPDMQEQIIRGVGYLMPVSRQLIASTISNVASARGAVSIVAFIALIWGGLGFFNSIRVSLNAIWGIRKPHHILKGQIINLIMMIGAAILLFLSVLLTAMFSTIYETGMQVKEVGFLHSILTIRILANILAIGLAFVVFLMIYKFIPGIRPKWKDIWLGAVVAAVLFEITKVIFIWYIKVFSPHNLVYGSIGTLVAFLMWTYLSALVFLLIAKITRVNIEMRAKADIVIPKNN
jgi:membrane protein